MVGVKQVSNSPHRSSCQHQRFLGRPIITNLILIAMLSAGVAGQRTSTSNKQHQVKTNPASAVPATPFPQPDQPPAPPPIPTLEQLPPRTPQVLWDGKHLSIKSENATLADILIALRERLKVAIEIPAGAAAERVAADLGPAPAREVLTSLLNGSRFDYIIQASDSDDGIQSVLLSARGGADVTAAGSVVTSASGARRIPSPYDSSRRNAATAPDSEPATSAGEAIPTPVEAVIKPDSDSASTVSEIQKPQSDSEPKSAVPDTLPAERTDTVNGQPTVSSAGVSPISADTTNQGQPSMPQMVKDLQSMYEQRRQLQAQRNQTASQP